MDNLFNNILANVSADITIGSAIVTMLVAVVFGAAIGYTYYKTQEENYQRSMAVTLLMLPIILSVIILFIGSNIARAFSLAGTLSIIRFRSAPGDPKDIGFIFFDIAAGLACGVGLFGYGAIFVAILCIIMILAEKFKFFEKKQAQKVLKITIPENLNYQGAFDEILKKYTKKYSLTRIKTTDLGSLFELNYNVMKELASQKDVSLLSDVPEGIIVDADESLLLSAITNLISNGIKYNNKSGRVSVSAFKVGDTTEIIVADNGIGISHENIDKIWKRFYRVDDVRNDEYGSSGLGLSMVKSIIELHGGKITVKSEPGKGTEFRIAL